MATVSGTIHRGAVAPYALRYVVDVPRDPETRQLAFDTNKVTAASFIVRRGGSEQEVEWTASIVEKVPDHVILSHVFQQGDVPELEQIHVMPKLTTADGPLYAQVRHFDVVDPNKQGI